MRKMLAIVALVATFVIAGNAIVKAEDYWWTSATGLRDGSNFDALGFREGGLELYGKSQTIGQLYLAGRPSEVSNTDGTTTTVGELFVTPNTIGYGNTFKGSGATIGNFTLYVGEPITIKGGNMTGTFGDAETSVPIVMSDSEINGVGSTFGTWQITGERKVINEGRINHLTYNGGNYSGNGTIGTLVAGKSLGGTGFKTVDKLEFANNGNGLITISGNGNYDGVTYDAVEYMGGVEASAIDFAGAGIGITLAGFESFTDFSADFDDWVGTTDGIGNTYTFDFATIFGNSIEITGIEDLFDFGFYYAADLFFSIFDEEGLVDGWNLDSDLAQISYTVANEPAPPTPVVPEPATLAMLGLGLAGLGLVARRRK